MTSARQSATAGEARRAVHAYLSEHAHDGWSEFAEANGVSVTGLIEDFGRTLSDEIDDAGDAADIRQDWVKRARKIDADRRRRGGG